MLFTSVAAITASVGTLQNSAIFSRTSDVSGVSLRQSRMSAWMPISRSSLTECCVGLVFTSPAALMNGTSVTCTNSTSFRCSSFSCLMASRNGSDSMSPTVPPISTMCTSACVVSESEWIRRLISSVTCGITCTVRPR